MKRPGEASRPPCGGAPRKKGSASGERPGCCERKRKTWVTHPGPPKNRPRDKRRVQGAPEPKHRGAPCHRTGERPATAQGSALATAQGSALALSIRSAATSHRHGLRASAGRDRAQPPSQRRLPLWFLKLFRNQAFRERLNTRTGERPAIPQPRGAPSRKSSSVGGASGCRRQRPLATAPGGPRAPSEPGHLQARATAAIEARKRRRRT